VGSLLRSGMAIHPKRMKRIRWWLEQVSVMLAQFVFL
jgi:hypothetical protein